MQTEEGARVRPAGANESEPLVIMSMSREGWAEGQVRIPRASPAARRYRKCQ
jgi:hypothetical protein